VDEDESLTSSAAAEALSSALLARVDRRVVKVLASSRQTGWKERLRNDPFCVEWDVQH